jgi:hypothetical protein
MRIGNRPLPVLIFGLTCCCLGMVLPGFCTIVSAASVPVEMSRQPATGENIVCGPEALYLAHPGPAGTVAVEYLGGGSGLLYAYSIKLAWDGGVVNTSPAVVTEGDLLSSLGGTWFNAYSSGPNEMTIDCALLGAQPGVSGPGTMFTVEFAGPYLGISPVDLTILNMRDNENNELSGFAERDGLITVYSYIPQCTVIDLVDIGNPGSESGHNLVGWGPIEPLHSGGTYGGIEDCRVIYASAANGDGEEWATVDLDFGDGELTPKCLTMHHLDGATRDAFEVYIYPPGQPESAQLIHSYAGDDQTAEIWYRTTILVHAAGVQTLEFVSTEPPWSGWSTYGQVAFDLLVVEDCLPTKDIVDIGNPESENGHNLDGWGPIEPANSGGNFGGIENCRAIYASEANGDGNPWASVDLYFGECSQIPKCLTMNHLDGVSRDAFDAYIHPPGDPASAVLVFSYPGDDSTQEIWSESYVGMFITGMWTVKFVSTEPPWSGWATYGQVCLDTISVKDCSLTISDVVSTTRDPRFLSEPMQPNPFRGRSFVKFTLPAAAPICLKIYDVAGREIRSFIRDMLSAGTHQIAWDGRDSQGRQVAGGLYLYRLEVSGQLRQTGKVMLLK